MMKKSFWLIVMNDVNGKNLFQTEQDYMTGINLLAWGSQECGTQILTFTLTGTHLYAVTAGTEAQQYLLLKAVGKKLHRMTSGRDTGMRLDLSGKMLWHIRGTRCLCMAICFVNSRCQSASLDETAYSYRWSAARQYFSDSQAAEADSIGNLTYRQYRKIFKFRNTGLPKHWQIEDGHVSAQSFCRIADALSYFADAHEYMTGVCMFWTRLHEFSSVTGFAAELTECDMADMARYLNLSRNMAESVMHGGHLP